MTTGPSSDPLIRVREALARGEFAAAEAACLAAIAANGEDARSRGLLAHVLHRAGRHSEALEQARRAVSLSPGYGPALMERAAAATAVGAWGEACETIQTLLQASPRRPALHVDLARARVGLGDVDGAIQSLDVALAIDPRLVEVWILRGATAHHARRLELALASYEAALGVDPRNLRALEGCADAQRDAGNFAGWIAARRRVCQAYPDSSLAWCRLGYAFRNGDLLAEARVAYAQALEADPGCLQARWAMFQLPDTLVYESVQAQQDWLARWMEGLAEFEAMPPLPAGRAAEAESCLALATNFHAHYLFESDPEPQRRYARVVRRLAATLVSQPPPLVRAGNRRRIGFVSAYFRRHTVGRLFSGLVRGLDRSRFETTVFHTSDVSDATTHGLAGRVDRMVRGERSISAWIETLREHPVDVLCFLDVGMHPITQALAALRFAPVQAALWGHPVTTGMETIDYFLGSDLFEAEDAQRHYTEKLVRLPGLGAWYEGPEPAAAAAPEGVWPAGTLRLLVPASVYKILPRHDVLLARIAEALPESALLLLPHARAHVCEALRRRLARVFASRRLDFEGRVRVAPTLPEPEFLALAAQADLGLDTIGWSGGMTMLDLLGSGLPMVTLPGATMRSRQTAALLGHLGAPELIARNEADYVARVLALARAPEQRTALRERLRGAAPGLYRQQAAVEGLAAFIDRATAQAQAQA